MHQYCWSGLGSLLLVLTVGCGGATPPTPNQPPPPKPSASAPAPAASSAGPSATQPAAQQFDVDVAPTRVSASPKNMPKVSIEAPGSDQFLPATILTKDFKARAMVRGWDTLPEGSYVQWILDNRPGAPVKDLKSPARLLDLAADGNIPEGEHVIAAFVCRQNHESYKGPDGVAIHRFWSGKVKTKDFKQSAPLLILNQPFGTYKGAEADDILIDFYVINVVLGDKDNYVHVTLKGPGIKEEGLSRNITEWRPYSIISPHSGQYTITAELMDKNGNPIEGVWNNTTRTFTVEK